MKRILTKEKIDRQFSGQSSTMTPIMKVSESHNSTNKKLVTFNTQDRLDDKIDKLTSMVCKLTAQGNTQDK